MHNVSFCPAERRNAHVQMIVLLPVAQCVEVIEKHTLANVT